MKVEIVDGPLDPGKPAKPRYRTARLNGKAVRVRIVDADSPTFGADLHSMFKANVRRAREENRALKLDA